MPFIDVQMIAGRTEGQRAAFAAAVTAAAKEHLDAAPEKVSIRFFDLQPSYVARAGALLGSETPASEPPQR